MLNCVYIVDGCGCRGILVCLGVYLAVWVYV